MLSKRELTNDDCTRILEAPKVHFDWFLLRGSELFGCSPRENLQTTIVRGFLEVPKVHFDWFFVEGQ